MVRPQEWVKVELNLMEMSEGEIMARFREEQRRNSPHHTNRRTQLKADILGARGEIAVAKWSGVSLDVFATWATEQRRGYDVAHYQVRTRSKQHYGLGFHAYDKIEQHRWLLVLGHECPVFWLAGWLDGAEAKQLAEAQAKGGRYSDKDKRWWMVEQIHLHPVDDHGFERQGEKWIIDPQTPFLCETCHTSHAIVEHRKCRAA